MEKQRMDYIDTLKGIGILFVVYCHVNYAPLSLSLVYSFHMPLFFLISGMLFRTGGYDSFGTFLRKRFKRLMVPYLIYSFLALGYLFVSERCFPDLLDVERAKYISNFWQIFLVQGSSGLADPPLWFVPALFLVEIMYYFLSKLAVAIRIPVCIALAAFGWLLESGLLAFDNTVLPWTMDSALFALSFYATGNMAFPLVKKGVERIKAHRHKALICVNVILVSAILWLPLALINGKISLGSRILENGILLFMTGVLGSVALLGLSLLVEKCPFLQFCGKNSFHIMATHYAVRRCAVPPVYSLLDIPMYNKKDPAQTVIPFLMVLAICLVWTFLIVRFRKKR